MGGVLARRYAVAMQTRKVVANGTHYAYLELGEGPLLLLLHGFPDNAYSWERQLPVFARAGYRVVAPFLRGYPPSEMRAGAYYDRATLALDVRELIGVLNGGKPADLVAQDWGAAIAYGVLGAFPEVVRRAVLLAVPHPLQIRRTLRRSPKHVLRSFHWFLFQLPWLPEALCRAGNFAFIEFLWRLWSPQYADREHVARIKQMLAQPGAMAATLAYYRAAMQSSFQDPALAELRARLDLPISVPTRVACGSHDMRREMLPGQGRHFTGPYEWTVVEGAGHFMHREKPDEVNALVLDWLRRS
jgi:pimeloyl-ACP methyl ester carboxylesterase